MRSALLLAALVACSNSTDTAGGGAGGVGGGGPSTTGRPANVVVCASKAAAEHPAQLAFQAALTAGDRQARTAVIEQLKAATLEQPNEEQFQLSLALAYLWRLGEPLEAERTDLAGTVAAAFGSRDALERAYAICPTDHRIPAWLGPVLVNMGNATQDTAMVEQGMAVLAKGMQEYPTFVAFSQLLVSADDPSMSAQFQQGVQVMEEAVVACLNAPDAAACTNTGGAHHNVQGTMLYLADAHAKLGNRDKVLGYLKTAREEAAWASWDFHADVEQRELNLEANLAALGDADASNDPELVWQTSRQCAVCHMK